MHRLLLFLLPLLLLACSPAKRPAAPAPAATKPTRPADKPRLEPMDTIRWTGPPPGAKPPIGAPAGQAGGGLPGSSYRLALLLPFLADQLDDAAGKTPEKSRLALQFYAGARLALADLSAAGGLNLGVDVYDTRAADADFQRLFADLNFDKANVYIGPVRAGHVSLMAERAKSRNKIVVSPESPTMDLTRDNPGFLQINPSLRAHCEAIAAHVRARHGAGAVTLVCREKEADRLPFFQNAPLAQRFGELVLPDAAANFDKTDLDYYLRPGRTAVFILPTWASQDFVMAFLRKLRAVKGNHAVEVYGMPQWKNFEAIDPEFLTALNVHISSAAYIDYARPEVKAFQQRFYDDTGTVPDEDAFNGYDVTTLVGRWLLEYGLSFPERLQTAQTYEGLRGRYRFARVGERPATESGAVRYDYLENKHVYILKFDKYGFVPAN